MSTLEHSFRIICCARSTGNRSRALSRAFLVELEMHGISPSSYNLPDWEDSGGGFRSCLDSLFRITPPSALILDEAFLFNLAQHHLAPEHISLPCFDPDPAFDRAYPPSLTSIGSPGKW